MKGMSQEELVLQITRIFQKQIKIYDEICTIQSNLNGKSCNSVLNTVEDKYRMS